MHFVKENVPENVVCETHWGGEKIAVNFQTTFSNTFPWMKIVVFRCKFHWNLLPRVHQHYATIGYDNGLARIGGKSLFEPMMV